MQTMQLRLGNTDLFMRRVQFHPRGLDEVDVLDGAAWPPNNTTSLPPWMVEKIVKIDWQR
jgi:hypothetical protein